MHYETAGVITTATPAGPDPFGQVKSYSTADVRECISSEMASSIQQLDMLLKSATELEQMLRPVLKDIPQETRKDPGGNVPRAVTSPLRNGMLEIQGRIYAVSTMLSSIRGRLDI